MKLGAQLGRQVPLPLRHAYGNTRTRVARLVFERGIFDTAPYVHLEDFGLAAPDRVPYTPSGWLFLRRALRRSDVTPQDVFIDFGSGMGRVVYLAARHYPFRRVIGVELSRELSERCRVNIEANRHRLACRDVDIVTADVMDFPIPDDLSVAYFYNPFRGPIFEHVIDGIVRSLDRRPRRIRLVYANPREDGYIASTGRFVRTKALPIRGLRRVYFEHPWISVWESTH